MEKDSGTGLEEFLATITNMGNRCVEKVEEDASLDRDTTDNNYRDLLLKNQERLSELKKTLGIRKETRMQLEATYKSSMKSEQERTKKLTKRTEKTAQTICKWKTEKDKLQQHLLDSLTTADNAQRFLDELAIGYGAESEADGGQYSIYLTKVHPTDLDKKYIIYFYNLRLKEGIFEVSTVSPMFKDFESIKTKISESSCIIEILGICVENWRKEMM